MMHQPTIAPKTTNVVGIAADHGGFELKEYLVRMLRGSGADVIDIGAQQLVPEDDYPDFLIPLARAVAAGTVDRGVAICGSGVGVAVAANKVQGVRACLIHDPFSARQGVEDDDLNIICLGGLVVGHAIAWELVRTFLGARFSGAARHRRRLAKVAALEDPKVPMHTEIHHTRKNTDAAAPLRIHLIRHGQTAWSISGQYTGRTDIALTAQGEEEARAVGVRLRGIPFTYVLASPMLRARRMCELAGLEPPMEIEPDLAEWDNGDNEGRTPAEILAERPDWDLFRDGAPNGELPAQISARADRVIARVSAWDGNVALFSHGHFLRVLAARWIGLSAEQAQPFLLDPASLSILCYAHARTDRPSIALWNSASIVDKEPKEHATIEQQ